MPRLLGNKDNTINLQDNISGSELEIYYRNPTTRERQGYQNAAYPRKRNKIKNCQIEARLNYGLRIITGFRVGDFVIEMDGEEKVISSRVGDVGYCEDWKDLLERYASDVVMIVAAQVFDAPTTVVDSDEEEMDDEGEDADEVVKKTLPPSDAASATQ